jgi:hypothetical protein
MQGRVGASCPYRAAVHPSINQIRNGFIGAFHAEPLDRCTSSLSKKQERDEVCDGE